MFLLENLLSHWSSVKERVVSESQQRLNGIKARTAVQLLQNITELANQGNLKVSPLSGSDVFDLSWNSTLLEEKIRMKPCYSDWLYSMQYLKLRQASHYIWPITLEISARISHKKKLPEMHILSQRLHAAQSANKIHSEVKLLKIFTTYTCIIHMYIIY